MIKHSELFEFHLKDNRVFSFKLISYVTGHKRDLQLSSAPVEKKVNNGSGDGGRVGCGYKPVGV